MKLGDYLNSINKTKKNIIWKSDSPLQAEKLYPKFPVARSLSYFQDCVLLVNELNIRGTQFHNVSNLQHYEFLLYLIEKGNRFARWSKPENDDRIDVIMQAYGYSYHKAREVCDIFTDEQIEELKKLSYEGGRK